MKAGIPDHGARIDAIAVAAYTVPTDRPEADGTLAWESTTLVLARVRAGGHEGLGYGYADSATACLIRDRLAPLLQGCDALATAARWQDMQSALRNLGTTSIAAMAISIIDTALWDLKGKCLACPLVDLLGRARDAIPAYGSGGFCSYDRKTLVGQLAGWADRGFCMVKMKVGRDPPSDLERVAAAADALGGRARLFVDANGAYRRKQALHFAERMSVHGVAWLEEPVAADDVDGLRLLRDRAPAGMDIAAGEYGYGLPCFRRLLGGQAVDVLQADATRCGGVTGFVAAAALCEAFGLPLSSHCAPALHMPLCCAVRPALHLEYFHDHVRIEHLLFDGVPQPEDGLLVPSRAPGLGITLREADARCYENV